MLTEPLFNKQKFVGGLIAYFVFFGLFASVDWIMTWNEDRRNADQLQVLEAMPASDWIEYEKIEPVSAAYGFDENIAMRSYLTRKQSANINWNDVLFCDKFNNGRYTNIQNYQSSRFLQVDEPTKVISTWTFGDATLQRPHDPVVTCYILSEQNICPAQVVDGDQISCKAQSIRSEPFQLTNP